MRSDKNTLFQSDQMKEAFMHSFVKLNPRLLIRNPVMFTVEIGTAVMLVVTVFSMFNKEQDMTLLKMQTPICIPKHT